MKMLLCRKVPAFDGMNLATDVFLPDGQGAFPCVITRIPYSRAGLRGTAQHFTERGYAYVTQDCRGKYDSDGQFIPLIAPWSGSLAPATHNAMYSINIPIQRY